MTRVAERQTGVRSSRARFERRARTARRRLWRAWALGLLLAALSAALVWVVAFSSVLAVTGVRVDGVSGDEAVAVRGIADDALGTPLARVDLSAIERRVSERKAIAEVTVERSWPRTLVVHAAPRTPAIVLKNPDGQLEVVDAAGVAYGTVGDRPAGVPLVNASTAAGVTPDALSAALSVVRSLPPELAHSVSDITVSSANLVTFSHGRTEVVWGGADQAQLKVRILQALLRTKPLPTLIDVSAPETPVSK